MAKGGAFEQVKPWASKTPEQALRIAGVLTLLEQVNNRKGNLSGIKLPGKNRQPLPPLPPIEADTMRRATELALWHLGEAVRLVGSAELSPEVLNAKALLAWCHETGCEFLYSSVALNRGPNRIRERARFTEAMDVLVSAGWAQPVDGGMRLDGAHRRHVWRIVPATEGGLEPT